MDKSLLFKKEQKNSSEDSKHKAAVISNKYFKYLIILGVVVLISAGYFLVLRPMMNSIQDLKRQQQEKDDFFKIKEAEWLKFKKQVDTFTAVEKKDLDMLDNMIPKYGNSEELMAYIDVISRKSGFVLNDISISDDKTKKDKSQRSSADTGKNITNGLRTVGVKFSVENKGGYQNLKRYLSTLEGSSRIIDITNLQYSPEGGINISCLMYYSE